MNVLLTCAGRRNYLIAHFKEALRGRGEVFAADNSPVAPALQEADRAFTVPTVYDPSYVEELLSICTRHRVRLLIPLNDLELPILAAAQDRFHQAGTIAVVSDADVINTSFDKWQTFLFASAHGIGAPATFLSLESVQKALDSGQLAFPLVVKPRWGTASISIEVCHDMEELELAYQLTKKRLPRTLLSRISTSDMERSVLIQQMLRGKEYGLDILNDLQGGHVCTFVKHKLAMRAGETDKATTIEDDELMDFGAKIGKSLGHVGNLDCDVFATDTGHYLLEMNPRFGGGYPFSHVAGANLPATLLAWADQEEPDPSWLRVQPGVTAAKCDRLVIREI